MRIVIALGGNALLKRGEAMTAEAQRGNVRVAAEAIAPIASEHQVVITHGNGPQVGLLALQGAAYKADEAYPLDVLGAETEGMIGYMIEQELGNLLPFEVPFATLLTMIEVDPDDPGFKNPTKFVGPVYDKPTADRIAKEKRWIFKADGDKWRRVVPSPLPKRIFQLRPIEWLLEGDPAIRWQVLRDLADASPDVVAAERSRIAREGWGAQILAAQNADGRWGGGTFFPRGIGTFDTLHLLYLLGPQGPWPVGAEYQWWVMLALLYLPALAAVLRRPNRLPGPLEAFAPPVVAE